MGLLSEKKASATTASSPVTVKVPDETQTENPTGDAVAEGSAWKSYWRVFTYAGPVELVLLAIATLAAIASGVAMASQNIIFGQFVTVFTDFQTGNGAAAQSFRNGGSQLALYYVYIGIGRFVVAYVYNTLLTYSAYRMVRNIRHEYLESALRQEVAYFDVGEGGSIATQAYSNGRLIQNGTSEKLGLTIQGVSAFFSAFIIAFLTNWKLTLIVCAVAPLCVIFMASVSFVEAGYETKVLEKHAQANAYAEGVLGSVRTVHAFEMRERLVARFDEFLAEAHRWGNKISFLLGVLFSAEYTIVYLGYGLAFWQGIRMLSTGEVANTGDVFTVLLSVIIAALSLTQIAPYSIEFTRAASAASQLFALIDRKSLIDPLDPSGVRPEVNQGFVELEGVSFAYPTRPGVTVLDDFTLTVPAGKITALVGPSGSGKSTIVGLLERWYNPNQGTIKLDGRPIETLNLNWLRQNVRLVQQEPVLFRGSVFDNIVHGLVGTPWEKAPREEQMQRVQEAAKMAFAHDFVTELPQGYDTEIGQRGGLLSGGQKQRIAIARSVVSQPKVLLLDEATSALDPHAEGIVQQALDKAAVGRTTIVIAHKLATIRKADNIVVMTKGRIVEQGTHESLIEQGGTYARLVKIQQLTTSANQSHPDSDSGGEEEDDTINAEGEDDIVRQAKSLTKYPTAAQERIQATLKRDDYENHRHLGFLTTVLRMVRETPGLWFSMSAVVGACVVACALFPAQAILMAHMVEVFTLPVDQMVTRGNFLSSMFVVLAAGCLVFYYILGYYTNVVGQVLTHKLRRDIFGQILRQDLQFFDRPENNIGALASRVDAHPQSVFELMSLNIGLITTAALNIASCSVLGIVYSWKLGLVIVLAGLPVVVGCGFLKMRFDAKLDRETAGRLSTSSAIASESVTAIRTVSSLAIERSVLAKYTEELDQAVDKSRRPLASMMVWFAATQGVEFWFMALGFWYGTRLVADREITLFQFFVSFMSVFFSAQATSQIFQFSTSMTKGMNGANYIFWLTGIQPTVTPTPENKDRGPSAGGPIDLVDVRFSYPLRPDATVLKDVSLDIKPGQFVALVGASGCGKSTIIAMLERFYDPATGTIRVAGDPLTELNPRLYRRMVALVQQEPTLFQGSIRENIALGIDGGDHDDAAAAASIPDDAAIERALRAANAWDFVSSLPDGLGTAAGSNGTQLSGGQRQRIAIARALIRDPKVLLLDEATSALDTESEKIVQEALGEAAKEGDRITIAVAHRLSTIKDAHVICVFFGGRIVEMGTHAELIALGGMYLKMCEAQSLE